MSTLARTDTSLVGRWWWTVDKWTLLAIGILMILGSLFTLVASPSVADRIGLDSFYFARRQIIFLVIGFLSILSVSLLSPKGIRRFALLLTLTSLSLMGFTIIFGAEIKGATRWLNIMGLSIQASEFVKPGFAVLVAWMISEQRLDKQVPGHIYIIILYVITVGMLLAQPDVGMTLVVTAILGVQIFVAGVPLLFVFSTGGVFLTLILCAYFIFDHVQIRIDRFLDPNAIEGFQVGKALAAFRDGGWVGRGPGEGRVKEVLPDAHADFIFAVVGEEFGLIACIVVVGLFLFIIVRGIYCVISRNDLFSLLAVSGLLAQLSVQSIINMASSLNLIPPKGMTLPFISYGGSSTLALGFTVGMLLSLTRSRDGDNQNG